MTRGRWRLAVTAGVLALAATALPLRRLRYLAMPIVHDPSIRPSMACMTLDDGDERAAERARVPGRVSAILPRADGTVYIGTFDSGLWRVDPARGGAPVAVGALAGRERFVDALAEHGGHIVVATHRGAILLTPAGARAGVIAAGEAVSSLAVVDGELVAGTAHGLWRARDDAPVGERGPDGEPLRVTALAAARGRLYVGTPDGVYVLAAPLSAAVAAWRPLVFGSPGASSNVVTALAPLGDGVLAGTDDGGTVFVGDRDVDARRFAEPRANDVSPGALAPVAGGIFVGTEGAGLIALDEHRQHARRLGGTAGARISAVSARDAALWFGRDDGAVYTVAASRIF